MKLKYALMVFAFPIFTMAPLHAASPVNDAHNLKKIGTVSISRAGTLDDLESLISKKADSLHGGYYKITSAGGNNTQHGTADVYK